MPAGRPTLLTPELIEDVRRLLPTCLYLETVGDYLGVHRTSWRKWLQRGAKEARRLQNPRAKPKASESLYLEFFYTHKKALSEGEISDLGTIKKASSDQTIEDADGKVVGMRKGEWQAAAWRLERRFPKRWGRKDRVEIDLLKEAERVKKMSNEQLANLFEENNSSGHSEEAGEDRDAPAGPESAASP